MDITRDVVKSARDGILIFIFVKPGSSKSGILGIDPWKKRLVVEVEEKATEGRANRAVGKLLSEVFGVKVSIVGGLKSREKVVLLGEEISYEDAVAIVEGFGETKG